MPPDFLASLSVEQRTLMWAESIEKKVPRLLLTEVAGEFAGFIAFGPCRDIPDLAGIFEIWAIYLNPPFIGLGAGRTLWLGALAALKLAGATTVVLWVLAENSLAIRFYLAAGFTEDSTASKSIQVGGISIKELRFVQRISD